VNYSKLHRWISIELALPRDQRVPAKHFLKEIRSQIDRLYETAPSIPPEAIELFGIKMKDIKKDITLPEVCNELKAVEIYPEDVVESIMNPTDASPTDPSKRHIVELKDTAGNTIVASHSEAVIKAAIAATKKR
jgi:hypothetical protein